MTEAEATRLPHPTPLAIILACYDAADAINAERASHGLPPLNPDWHLVLKAGVARANKEHHDEPGSP